jgi:hypothetical protein
MNGIINYAISIARSERVNRVLDKSDYAIYVLATTTWLYAKKVARVVFSMLCWVVYKDNPRFGENTNIILRAMVLAPILVFIALQLIYKYNNEITNFMNSIGQ